LRFLYLCKMETNRQKKIAALLQRDLVDILQGEIRKNAIVSLVISVSKVYVTTDLSLAKVYLSVFPNEKSKEIVTAISSNAQLIKHELAQRVRQQLRKVPNLIFYNDDSHQYLQGIESALKGNENPIENRDLLVKRKKI